MEVPDTVAFNVKLEPAVTEAFVLLMDSLTVEGFLTVILQEAFLFPILQVITAVPCFFAATFPLELTDATVLLDELQDGFFLVPVIIARSCLLFPL